MGRFIIAYAVVNNESGFEELGQIGIFKDQQSAFDRIAEAKQNMRLAGFRIIEDAVDHLVAWNPIRGSQKAYWIIHV